RQTMTGQIEDDHRKFAAQTEFDQMRIQTHMIVVAMQKKQCAFWNLCGRLKVMTGNSETCSRKAAEAMLNDGVILITPARKIQTIKIKVTLSERGNYRRGEKVDLDQTISQIIDISGSEHP